MAVIRPQVVIVVVVARARVLGRQSIFWFKWSVHTNVNQLFVSDFKCFVYLCISDRTTVRFPNELFFFCLV